VHYYDICIVSLSAFPVIYLSQKVCRFRNNLFVLNEEPISIAYIQHVFDVLNLKTAVCFGF